MFSLLKKIFKLCLFILVVFILLLVLSDWQVKMASKNKMYSEIEKVPEAQAALVLGAQVINNARLSDVFRDRVDTAYELYQKGKVKKILISGDNSSMQYNEVVTAQKYLLEKGVPKEVMVLDYAGFDTYDSVYRAKEIFQAESLIIVTQEFHLPRALFIAEKLKIPANGMVADKHQYVGMRYYALRERLAKIKAFFDVMLNAKPKYLGEVEGMGEIN